MDSDGVERYRIEGYLPKDWFRARLEMGLARVAFMHKKFADAQKIYEGVVEKFGKLAVAAEAIYYREMYATTKPRMITRRWEPPRRVSRKVSG